MLLSGKTALVTGAGRGIGRDHALALAAAGAKVVVNDLGGGPAGGGGDANFAQEVVKQIRAAGGVAEADTRSVADWGNAQAIVADVVAAFGGIDIVVNNAGISRPGLIGQLAEQDWDLQSDVNIKGTVAIVEAAVRHWQVVGPGPGRSIINTASPAATHPVGYIALYSATKAAVAAFSQAAAQELAPLGVRVNAITPMARTRLIDDAPPEMIALMAPREGFDRYLPEHVSQLIVYLASPLCRFTGRLFGLEGDDVFLYKEWNAEHYRSNAGVKWTPETLDKALSDVPAQDERWNLFPGGRQWQASPPDETLNLLAGGRST